MMIGFNKKMMRSTILYALLVLLSLLASLASDQLAYVVFFFSSIFFSARIVYETWKESKPLKEIKYPTGKEVFTQKELERLSVAVQDAVSGKSSSTYVMSRLRQILLKKISLRLDITQDRAEELLENPADLQDSGYDKSAGLISEHNFLTGTRNGRMRLLNDILDQLEEN